MRVVCHVPSSLVSSGVLSVQDHSLSVRHKGNIIAHTEIDERLSLATPGGLFSGLRAAVTHVCSGDSLTCLVLAAEPQTAVSAVVGGIGDGKDLVSMVVGDMIEHLRSLTSKVLRHSLAISCVGVREGGLSKESQYYDILDPGRTPSVHLGPRRTRITDVTKLALHSASIDEGVGERVSAALGTSGVSVVVDVCVSAFGLRMKEGADRDAGAAGLEWTPTRDSHLRLCLVSPDALESLVDVLGAIADNAPYVPFSVCRIAQFLRPELDGVVPCQCVALLPSETEGALLLYDGLRLCRSMGGQSTRFTRAVGKQGMRSATSRRVKEEQVLKMLRDLEEEKGRRRRQAARVIASPMASGGRVMHSPAPRGEVLFACDDDALGRSLKGERDLSHSFRQEPPSASASASQSDAHPSTPGASAVSISMRARGHGQSRASPRPTSAVASPAVGSPRHPDRHAAKGTPVAAAPPVSVCVESPRRGMAGEIDTLERKRDGLLGQRQGLEAETEKAQALHERLVHSTERRAARISALEKEQLSLSLSGAASTKEARSHKNKHPKREGPDLSHLSTQLVEVEADIERLELALLAMPRRGAGPATQASPRHRATPAHHEKRGREGMGKKGREGDQGASAVPTPLPAVPLPAPPVYVTAETQTEGETAASGLMRLYTASMRSVEEREQELARLTERLQERSGAADERDRLQAVVSHLEEARGEAAEELEAVGASIANCVQALATLNAQKGQLQRENGAFRRRVVSMQKELASMQRETDERESESFSPEQRSLLISTIKELQRQLSTMTMRAASLANEREQREPTREGSD
ncbi:hypothetical protein KIPB_000712 [Kipferlia bialata]|uniref:Uncharacterized protein n=1 Tax=Kipferlia bialata TaxID=797122 RepID=A0A9K3GEL6_9EUKA|nr:hypothetical protein KIPB_000712 [Kipferlia bialata]|eukprot:g712.t1